MNEREEFEATVLRATPTAELIINNGEYIVASIQHMWLGWQAAKESSRKQVEEAKQEWHSALDENKTLSGTIAELMRAVEELQAKLAMQDEALQAYQRAGFGQSTDTYLQGTAYDLTIKAISATSADVAAWQEKRDKEVAAKAEIAALEDAAKLCEAIGDDYERTEYRRCPEMRSDAVSGAEQCMMTIKQKAAELRGETK